MLINNNVIENDDISIIKDNNNYDKNIKEMKDKDNRNNQKIKNKRKSKRIEIEVCQKIEIHESVVKEVKLKTPEPDKLTSLAEFFKIIGDKTRIEILYALLIAGEMCVCDLSYVLQKSQSAISHQLRVLRQAKLVKYRKAGKVVYYSLDDDHVKTILDDGFSHIIEKY